MSGIRRKYQEQYKKGTNGVVIDPDISKEFPTAQAVNNALRRLLAKEKDNAT